MRYILSLALLTSASIAEANVFSFDNSGGAYLWTALGAPFDPTLGPTAQATASPSRSLEYVVFLGAGSNTVGPDFIQGGASIQIVRNNTTVFVQRPFGGAPAEFQPAAVFSGGSLVGDVGPTQSFVGAVAVGYFNANLDRQSLIGLSATIGFRVLLDDGLPHYGYVELVRRIGPIDSGIPGDSILMFQPVRWAYETEPNTPITVIPTPAAVSLVCAVFAARRRRS